MMSLHFDRQHTLTRLEAPFPLAFKGSSLAETVLRLFDCSMNQQETLNVYTGPLSHERIHTKKEDIKHRQWLCIVWRSNHNELNGHEISETYSGPGKLLIDKEDHPLSRCVVESKFHMNTLRGLREKCVTPKMWWLVVNFKITSTELKEQESYVSTDTLIDLKGS